MNYLEFPDGSLFWQQTTYLRWYMEEEFEEFEEFEEHPQDVMEQYQDYPYDYDYW